MPNSERAKNLIEQIFRMKTSEVAYKYEDEIKLVTDTLALERAEARRAAIEECAQVANSCTRTEIMATQQSMRQYIVSALRSKLAAPEKEDTKPVEPNNSCNRHENCTEAELKFQTENGRKPGFNFHCDDPCCEDCFGC